MKPEAPSKRIIFLDVDGVLNSHQSVLMHRYRRRGDGGSLCPIACANLQCILDTVPTADIVITSSWRLGMSLDQIRKIFRANFIDGARVIGETPCLPGAPRGEEIQAWLESHAGPLQVVSYVIIDDSEDMGPLHPRLVQTSYMLGLMHDRAIEVIRLLDPMCLE